MGLSFFEVFANIATGGAYSLTKDTVGTLAGVARAIASPGQTEGGIGGPSGTGVGTPIAGQMAPGGMLGGSGTGHGSPAVSAPIQSQKCCCWKISGDYLLNGETGQVWFINKDKMELLPLKLNLLPVESAARAMTLVAMKHVILEQKDTEIAQMPHAARGEMSGHLNSLVKALGEEIAR